MNTQRSRIRPRMRGADATPRSSAPPDEPAVQQANAGDELPGLTMLARLPDVSGSNLSSLTQQFDWLKKLDWKRVRRMNFDPNWVAGGVLALVLLLLLVITLNRTPKPAAPEAAAQKEAPTWNGGGKSAAPTTLTATPNVATANPTNVVPGGVLPGAVIPGSVAGITAPASAMAGAGQVQPGMQQGPSYASQPVAASQPVESSQRQFSLEGVFYPRTPYPAAVGHPIDHAVNQPAGSSLYGRELRTAQRDVSPPYAPAQPASPQTGRAQLEGIISQP